MVWQSFLFGFNWRSFFLADQWKNSNQLELYTDASGYLGYDAVFGRHWCYGQWPPSWCHLNIAFLELYPIVLSLHLWGHDMENQRILFFTDNEALVHVINEQSCRDKNLLFLVRRLVLVCLERNICFKAKHIPGVHNVLAAALSRLKFQTFKQLAPACKNPHPTEIPHHLQPLSWHQWPPIWCVLACNHLPFPLISVRGRFSISFTIPFFHLPFAFLLISPSLMALFIAYIFNFHYAPSAVTTYISALSYSHKLLGLPDPSKVFLCFPNPHARAIKKWVSVWIAASLLHFLFWTG